LKDDWQINKVELPRKSELRSKFSNDRRMSKSKKFLSLLKEVNEKREKAFQNLFTPSVQR